MKTNERGIALIKDFEKLALKAYRDPVGVWTCGFGHTGPDVHEGQIITEMRAEDWFRDDLAKAERAVSRNIKGGNRCQFSALVSFTFNAGEGALRQSSMLRFHNAGNHAKAAESFMLWNRATGKDGKKQELKGLTRRRAAEAALYLTPIEADEVADQQRTRASDVEPSPVGPAPQVSGATIGTGGAVTVASAAGIQAVSQASTIWSWLVDHGIEPKVVLAVLGISLTAALIGLGWKLIESRRVRG